MGSRLFHVGMDWSQRTGRRRRRSGSLQNMQLRGLEVEFIEEVPLILRDEGLLLVGRKVRYPGFELCYDFLLKVGQRRNDR